MTLFEFISDQGYGDDPACFYSDIFSLELVFDDEDETIQELPVTDYNRYLEHEIRSIVQHTELERGDTWNARRDYFEIQLYAGIEDKN